MVLFNKVGKQIPFRLGIPTPTNVLTYKPKAGTENNVLLYV